MSDSEEEEEYPPWLNKLLDAEYYNLVRVIALDEKDKSQQNHVRCKEIEVPDAIDAAEKPSDKSKIRRYRLSRFTPVLVLSQPADPPYIGLIDKIWLKKAAKAVEGTQDMYTTSDLSIECYWFYRPREVPENAWSQPKVKRKDYSGAHYSYSSKSKLRKEQFCERQLLFSSHHTMHDYPEDQGLLALEGFMQTCTLHWLGLQESLPERYMIRSGRLVRVREPGFVVQGFLWCNSKHKEQYHPSDKLAYALDANWGDGDDGKETKRIVEIMFQQYKVTAERLKARNETIRQLAAAHRAAKRAGSGPYPQLSDDDGDPSDKRQQEREAKLQQVKDRQQQQQQQQQQRPPSPRSPDLEPAAAAAAARAGSDDAGDVQGMLQVGQHHDDDWLKELEDDVPVATKPQQQQQQQRRLGHNVIDSDDDDD